MKKKHFIFYFIAQYAALLLTALAFYFTDVELSLLPGEQAQVSYIMGICCALTMVGGSFLAIKKRNWSPYLRQAMLIVPALLAMFLFFFLEDGNMLYCLPILVIVSFILLKQVLEE